jgi:eukaryotic-like serine/threonine-protein kinase
MTIGPGTRIGAYEVTALLGEGGMGQVWRAHHTALKRDDALKVLPEAVAADPERVARFEREAQVLASLNHPNIAHVYGLEEADGAKALVMELIEGPTLADRIAQIATARGGRAPGGLEIEEALAIARQIAEALAVAHEQGIVHRDLKPANIKVRADGTVKVLDFGLAKILEAGEAGGAGSAGGAGALATASPTITSPALMTGVGTLLGTAAYMSPEQAKGREANRRSDIWAYGCVLYEMLTGKRAFDGEDVADTLAAALRSEPDWSAVPSGLPVAVRTLIERCLEKDPRKRVADISTALFVLREASILRPAARIDLPSGATLSPSRPLWRHLAPIVVTAVVAAVLGGATAWRFSASGATPSPVTRFSFPLGDGQRLPTVARSLLAVSPDGSKIAYIASGRLYVRSTSDLEARPIPGSDVTPPVIGMFDPVFSPDGNAIAFVVAANRPSQTGFDVTIKRIPVTGGSPVTICSSVGPTTGLGWGPDGVVFADSSGRIQRVSPTGGKPELLVSVAGNEIPAHPQMLPGGLLLFSVGRRDVPDSERWDKGKIVVHSLQSGKRTTIFEGGSNARYVATGHLLYANGGVLFAMPFDVQSGRHGEQAPVVEGIRRTASLTGFLSNGTAQFSVSNTGTLVFVPGPSSLAPSPQRSLVLVDRKGSVEELKVPPGTFDAPRVSPDGKRIAVVTDDGKEASVWIYELSGGTAMRRLTLGGRNRFPVWTADGERVAFQSDREGDLGIFWQPADGTSPAERLTTAEKGTAQVPESWSPKGDRLLFSVMKDSKFTLSAFSTRDKRATELAGVQSRTPINAAFSPDGSWVAYQSGEFGSGNVYVQPFPPTGATIQVSRNEDAHHPAWSRDGKELFYIPGPNQFAVRAISTRPTFTFADPILIPRGFTESTTPTNQRGYDIMPDGRWVGVVPSAASKFRASQVTQIEVVVNWFEELKSRVPTK